MSAVPQVTLFHTPSKISPVNIPNQFGFTASFSSTVYGSIDDSKLIVKLWLYSQDLINGHTIQPIISQLKIPPRDGTLDHLNATYVFDPSNILKTFVTYPYDSDQAYMYVNEESGFSSLGVGFSNYPTIAPETEGIVRYKISYAMEWNPGDVFVVLDYNTIGGVNYVRYTFPGVNFFVDLGDTMEINVYDNKYSYYNGETFAQVITTIAGNTYITTYQVWDPATSTTAISGVVSRVTHPYGLFGYWYGINATQQFYDRNRDFTEDHLLTVNGPQKFLCDYGQTPYQPLQLQGTDIFNTVQPERIRFIADFNKEFSSSYTQSTVVFDGLYRELSEYNTPYEATLGTHSAVVYYPPVKLNIIDPGTGATYSYKVFTLQAFHPSTGAVVNIFQDRIYKLTLFIKAGSNRFDLASIYYKGNVYSECEPLVRIKFLNNLGSWSYWNFKGNSQKQVTNITRTEYKRPLEFSPLSYSLSNTRGNAVLATKAYETFTINTDWITEDESEFLNQLVISPEVYIYQHTTLANYPDANIPIIITDTSYKRNTLKVDKIFSLTITYKYAFDTNIQQI